MRKYNLALMSYTEIGAIAKERAVLLLPVGCVEQHGPAGFTGADTILAEYVCRGAAEALDDVYVAPPLWFGYTPYGSFPGTVSLRLATLEALVQDVVEGYIAHGFRHLVVVNNHGPNEAAIEPVAARVRKEHGIVLSILYPWRLANHVAADLYPNAQAVYGHGGEPTISVMMALAPGVIALPGAGVPGGAASSASAGVSGAASRGYVSPEGPFQITSYRAARFAGFEIGLFNEASRVLPSGASGDWTVATEERGREILRRMVDYAVQFVPAFLRLSQQMQRRL
jgi:creatinine amidohydrolase/Fe(II)-dependent formamide hydrolase-like protein